MSEFNPIPNSLKKYQGTCPSSLIHGNCSNTKCEWVHPKIKKVKKKKLQFKKKEFKPSKLVKKGVSVKQRMKQKNLANKGKVYSFQPSKNIANSFKKKTNQFKANQVSKKLNMKKNFVNYKNVHVVKEIIETVITPQCVWD